MILDCYINENGIITISIDNKKGWIVNIEVEDVEMLEKFNDMLESCISIKILD